MAHVWRFLFENLQWNLLSSIRRGSLSGEAIQLRESLSVTALSGAADILRAADLASDPDADTIWTVWDNLFPPWDHEDVEHPEAWSRLRRVYDELSACVVAWLLHEVVRLENESNDRQRLLKTTQRRVIHLEEQRPIIDRVSEMIEVDESTASRVWAHWTDEQMPEWEVVILESLRTGLLRLLILSIITGGVLIQERAEHWARLIQDDEVRTLTDEVLRAFEMSGIPVAATTESVLEYFRSMKRLAARAHAVEIRSRPISEAILSNILASAREGWREARELPTLLEDAGCSVSEGDSFSEVYARVPRTFLVADTESVGQEKWIGAQMGRGIAREEMRLAVRGWMEYAEAVPEGASMERILEQMGDRTPLVLLLPVNRRVEVAARENRSLVESSVKTASTPVIPDNTALLIWAADESWQVGNPEDLSVTTQDLDPSPDEDDAYVLVQFRYGRPRATGSVRVLRFSTGQLASERRR